jgi:serine/threonine-protein kinase
VTSSAPSFGPGTVVADRYRIEAKLGEGGYGAVYSAVQLGMDRKVALKLLHPDVLSRKTALERFLREARLAQQLSHPNVVRLLDYGTTREGVPFIAFELLSGRSVERELAGKGALPAARVLHVAQQTLKGLMEAHGLGIVHRDIKPGNLFLCDFAGEPDFVKILDFGIAAAPNEGTRSGPLTLEARRSARRRTCLRSRSSTSRSTVAPISTPSGS